MTAFPPQPTLSTGGDPEPGGGRRFAIALAVTFLVLAGATAGMVWWMKATSNHDVLGPDQLKPPDFPYYRR
jgi:flagellar basal body-associated protein FliL